MDEKNLNRRQMLGGVAVAAGAAALGQLGASGNARAADAANASAAAPNAGASQAPTITNVKDKVCYITGGSSGIGLGIARALHEQGAKVILGNIDEKQFPDALKMFPENDPRVATVVHNVMDRDIWEKKADEIEKKFGPVHILVNNAGVGLGAGLVSGTYNDYNAGVGLGAGLVSGTYNDWDWGMGVNFWGPVYGVKTFVPRMRARPNEGCHIVTTTSTSGILVGLPVGIYAVSKIAATGLMEQLRDDLKNTNIGTSTLIPGLTQTNIGQSESHRPENLKNDAPPAPRAGAQARAGGAGAARPPQQRPVAPDAGPFWARPQDPITVGRLVVNAILNNDLFIFPAPEYRQGMEARAAAYLESMVPFTPIPANIQAGIDAKRYMFTSMYEQEAAHRRTTRNRKIAGI
jgi:NAD(P)-dependent dehydrogenase (short-subunit alcohol dehydrogenase family)